MDRQAPRCNLLVSCEGERGQLEHRETLQCFWSYAVSQCKSTCGIATTPSLLISDASGTDFPAPSKGERQEANGDYGRRKCSRDQCGRHIIRAWMDLLTHAVNLATSASRAKLMARAPTKPRRSPIRSSRRTSPMPHLPLQSLPATSVDWSRRTPWSLCLFIIIPVTYI